MIGYQRHCVYRTSLLLQGYQAYAVPNSLAQTRPWCAQRANLLLPTVWLFLDVNEGGLACQASGRLRLLSLSSPAADPALCVSSSAPVHDDAQRFARDTAAASEGVASVKPPWCECECEEKVIRELEDARGMGSGEPHRGVW